MLFAVPEAMVEQASRFYAAGREPVRPRVAATVLLLRPTTDPSPATAPGPTTDPGPKGELGGTGFEVYLIRRVAAVAFGGVYAFPGGGVDPSDAAGELDWAGPDPEHWAARLGCPPDQARAVVCAAAREVFEESGVLLAGPDETTVVDAVDGPEWEVDRQALLARTLSFAELLRRRRLTLRSDLLAAWSRWITPDFEPRRFDAHFFVARLPIGQATRDVSGEADQTVWIRPGLALDRAETGDWQLLPPTRVTLDEVAGCADPDAVFAAAAGRDPAVPVTPQLHVDPDGTVSFAVVKP
ncbi:NUDIX hydrolase [Solwaraspora sp. WMMD792]|uniref:NUDIX hydrolase n=1 Tax=Solwaraspora sp. WMMD792 TaxID=3016099 RepID=UPI002415AD7D|nr:NUDIX hydrolase [Solwaraspora sp. WMMD792]MDG4773240.1 NUDIX hydrolase [Solwaraspora sp. WMMD792]